MTCLTLTDIETAKNRPSARIYDMNRNRWTGDLPGVRRTRSIRPANAKQYPGTVAIAISEDSKTCAGCRLSADATSTG